MSRAERFFFWLKRINAVALFVALLALAVLLGREFFRQYDYEQTIADEKFGNQAEKGPYSGESIDVSGGEVVAYYQEDEENRGRREGSDITLVDPKSGKSRRIAGSDGAWVVNWELIFRQNDKGEVAIGYLARVATEAQYAAGRFDLVAGNLPGLEQKTIARNVVAADLPKVDGDHGTAFILWSEPDKAAFVAIDLRDLSIRAQRDIPLPVVHERELTQGPGPRRSVRHAAEEAAPVATHD